MKISTIYHLVPALSSVINTSSIGDLELKSACQSNLNLVRVQLQKKYSNELDQIFLKYKFKYSSFLLPLEITPEYLSKLSLDSIYAQKRTFEKTMNRVGALYELSELTRKGMELEYENTLLELNPYKIYIHSQLKTHPLVVTVTSNKEHSRFFKMYLEGLKMQLPSIIYKNASEIKESILNQYSYSKLDHSIKQLIEVLVLGSFHCTDQSISLIKLLYDSVKATVETFRHSAYSNEADAAVNVMKSLSGESCSDNTLYFKEGMLRAAFTFGDQDLSKLSLEDAPIEIVELFCHLKSKAEIQRMSKERIYELSKDLLSYENHLRESVDCISNYLLYKVKN